VLQETIGRDNALAHDLVQGSNLASAGAVGTNSAWTPSGARVTWDIISLGQKVLPQ
jgi:hypothetical protein